MQQRLAIVDRLANSQEAEDALLADLAALRQQRQQDWTEAQRLGWTPRDLKRLKLRSPAERARPSRRGKPPASPAQEAAPAAPAAAAAAAPPPSAPAAT